MVSVDRLSDKDKVLFERRAFLLDDDYAHALLSTALLSHEGEPSVDDFIPDLEPQCDKWIRCLLLHSAKACMRP